MIFELLSCVGISYKKSNTDIRSQFALTTNQIEDIYKNSPLSHILILSTCNRTEIYSFNNSIDDLIKTIGFNDIELFQSQCYIINGKDSFEHLIKVTAGIDSQLLGDYEIAGQVRDAIKLADKHNKLGGYFEKITNFAQSIAKTIRSETKISKGSVSVSKAAVNYLKQNISDISNQSILVIGAGKIGRSTMKHIISDLNTPQITLINRTDSITDEIAKNLNIGKDTYSNLYQHIHSSDIIITATNSPSYIIEEYHINNSKILIDLSIPKNINPKIKNNPKVKLIDVDELSKVKDETLKMREKEIQKGEEIMKQRLDKFETQINQGIDFVKKYLIK